MKEETRAGARSYCSDEGNAGARMEETPRRRRPKSKERQKIAKGRRGISARTNKYDRKAEEEYGTTMKEPYRLPKPQKERQPQTEDGE